MERAGVVIVGAGAAGLMAAIWAARAARAADSGARVIAFDGAAKLGAKILVAGGGRCNVTHHEVTERAYAGWSRNAVKRVLRRFGVAETTAFFRELGVELKREPTGKLFPTTDRAKTVLDALLAAAGEAGAELRHPARVETVVRTDDGFEVSGPWGAISADRVVLATGGKALPKSGSDGQGYGLARSLGHTITERVFPALVPLVLEKGHTLRTLSGLTTPARVELRGPTGKRLVAFEDSTLCTHFGLSGPSVMDISRYYTDAWRSDQSVRLVVSWVPGLSEPDLDGELLNLGGRSVLRALREHVPERLARVVCEMAGVEPATTGAGLRKDARRALVGLLCAMPLPVVGDRGFTHAEATAGGIPQDEVDLKTMGSRVTPGLHLCGEICDVDGRIGGFNFQWAWATGFIAGGAAVDPAVS